MVTKPVSFVTLHNYGYCSSLRDNSIQTSKMRISQDNDVPFNMGSIQSLGILNALKTGDPKLDMIVALLMPFALKFLIETFREHIKWAQKAWKKWWYGEKKSLHYHERSIEHAMRVGSSGTTQLDCDSHNNVLLKAIRLYLHAHIDLRLKQADLSLTTAEDRTFVGNMRFSRTVAGMLSSLRIIKNPPRNQWHKLGKFGKKARLVDLKIEKQQGGKNNDGGNGGQQNGDNKINVTTYRFRSLDGTAIDAFIQTAYDWYLSELKENEDHSRYFYDMKEKEIGLSSEESSKQRRFTRFKLSDEKTFRSLFFPEKDATLKLVDSFVNKKGRYAIPGYPQKLGIMLHGPPGTGKTSFIKALAQYTGRHVVNVPLAKISTNAELTSVFFDKRYSIDGEGTWISLDFKDVIFVMEDVDAASNVVKRRDGKKTAEVIQTEHLMDAPKPIWHMLLESEDKDCKELVRLLVQKSDRLKAEATSPQVVHSVAKRMMSLPALGLAGLTVDQAATKLSNKAIKSSQAALAQHAAVGKFLGFHARTLKRLVEEGAPVDDALVDELLGIERSAFPPLPNMSKPLSRDVSYSKYSDSDGVHVETNDVRETLSSMSTLLHQQPQTEQVEEGIGGAIGTSSFSPTTMMTSSYPWGQRASDRLNLTGILNVLDGVVDTPSRIVIMTTNHPEKLDPALIRPGRIDKKLHMGFMVASDLIELLEHYFQTTLDESQRQRIETTIAGDPSEMRPRLNVTPAQVEQLTSEYEDVNDMIPALEEKGLSAIPLSKSRLGQPASSEITYSV